MFLSSSMAAAARASSGITVPQIARSLYRLGSARKEIGVRTDRAILIAIAVLGWAVAAALALWLVSRLGFIGLALIGVGIWFVCTRLELEKEGAVGHELTPDLFAMQIRARQQMSRAERASLRADETLLAQGARLVRHIGIGLAAIGLGGFLLYQL